MTNSVFISDKQVRQGLNRILTKLQIEDKQDILSLFHVLTFLRKNEKISLAYLFGSFASGKNTTVSDMDVAVYINHKTDMDWISIQDKILMSTNRDIHILRLDEEEEDPFIVADVMEHGMPLTPITNLNVDIYYRVCLRAFNLREEINSKTLLRPLVSPLGSQ